MDRKWQVGAFVVAVLTLVVGFLQLTKGGGTSVRSEPSSSSSSSTFPTTEDTSASFVAESTTVATPLHVVTTRRPIVTDPVDTSPDIPRFQYLSDAKYVSESTDGMDNFDFGVATVNGQTYAHSLSDPDVYEKSRIEYDLGRHYDRFRSIVGVVDDSETTTRLQFDVYLDDRPVFSQRVKFGSIAQVDLSVSGGLRLRLEITNIPGGTRPTGVYGDARVFATGSGE
jgi:NPCBM/NEW2 domain-containing protein